MKTFHIANWLIIGAAFTASSLQAQMLNGRYGGEAEGTDINGAALHQVTKWTFTAGKLVKFEEIITFPNATGISACDLFPVRRRPTLTQWALQATAL